jgi:glycosyltransferase involved in cell wall biosynthesis
MHILFLPTWYPTLLFPERCVFFRSQAVALATAGLQVGVIFPDLLDIKEFLHPARLISHRFRYSFQRDEGINTIMLHGVAPPFMRRHLFIAQTQRLLDEYIQRFGRPDLIHAHVARWGGIAAAIIHERTNIPYIITEHASFYALNQIKQWQKPIIRQAFQKAAKLLAVSNSLARDLSEYALAKPMHIVPNIVNTKYFIPPYEKRNKVPFTFLAVAWLKQNKGFDVLLKAFALAFSRESNVILEIGGDGPERTKLKKLASSLGIEHKVRFLGLLSQEQVRNSMWRANSFLLTSYVETFGVVLTEALATGLPVIATKCGGPEDFVTSDMGYLVECGDVEALADKMICLRKNYDKFEGQYNLYYKKIHTHFGFQAVASQLIQHYQNVFKKPLDKKYK